MLRPDAPHWETDYTLVPHPAYGERQRTAPRRGGSPTNAPSLLTGRCKRRSKLTTLPTRLFLFIRMSGSRPSRSKLTGLPKNPECICIRDFFVSFFTFRPLSALPLCSATPPERLREADRPHPGCSYGSRESKSCRKEKAIITGIFIILKESG